MAVAFPTLTRPLVRPRSLRAVGLILLASGLALAIVLSLRIGSIGISNGDAWDALFNYDSTS